MMFSKLSKNSSVKSILVFSLSNVGDVVLACPVIDVLLRDFPDASLTVLLGDKTKTLFAGNPRIETVVFQKHLPVLKQLGEWMKFRQRDFDVLVDLRQTALGLFLPCRWRTPILPRPFKGHLQFKHMDRLRTLYPDLKASEQRLAIVPKPVDGFDHTEPYVVLVPGAADSAKRWPAINFGRLADALAQKGKRVVFTGGNDEVDMVKGIQDGMKSRSVSLAGRGNLSQLAFVLKNAQLAVTHDSGAMHISSYFNTPTLALFGPTDPVASGPWSKVGRVVHHNQDCPRCQNVNARDIKHNCMDAITVEEVINAFEGM